MSDGTPAGTSRHKRSMFEPGTGIDDLKAFMEPFVARLGYKFNTETEFVDEVLEAELEILERDGDIYCPCRVRSGDPKQDAQIVCPCIPFYRDEFARIRKCWCGLFILADVEDGEELLGVIEEPEGPIDVPAFALADLPSGQIRHIKIGKRDIAVARVGDEFFALSNVCRHAFGPLGEGLMDGYMAMCPWHGWRYDVRDGTTDHPNADVRTFETVVRDDFVFIRI
ncbi:MAG: ferredoxin-thioredoxin reductase catalytic domain-containing protein [Coriobacteriia bacterium]|nr:ferredoxin-thioredoxin reductase catalytic domain-containing protein [Coriobacteriia bacterium]MDO9108335.1 ferredoxin-thioredoxin reductase catalytic domain-containing protein [Coriobacteriia bacterium]